MIRTIADLLSEILKEQLPLLDASIIKHAPTIGDMYEGLSSNLLQQAIPNGLDLKIVTGFITDGMGTLTGQLDCMLVQGDGEQLPYTNTYIYHTKDVICVIEVKKKLYSTQMGEALDQLRSVRDVEHSYWNDLTNDSPNEHIDINLARRTFSETTRRAHPQYHEIDTLPPHEQLIYHTLVSEQLSITRIVLGLHGFKSEAAFRKALVDLLRINIGKKGYGPGSLPHLIISGNYSLVKANGRPYSIPLVKDEWPFFFSTPVNPLLILLEVVWTRLDELFGLGEVWGEDLEIEVARPLLFIKGSKEGWQFRYTDPAREELESAPATEPWKPAFVSTEEHVILARLGSGQEVHLDDADLLAWLKEKGVAPEGLRDRLLQSGLAVMKGQELRLITIQLATAILPTGQHVAAENNTGRLTRWVTRYMEGRAKDD